MRSNVLARRLAQLASLLATLLVASLSLAGGRVQWKSTSLDERENKSWQLEITIYLAKAPDVPHIPVKFSFEPVSYFERAMVEGDKLVERTVPLVGHQPLIESVDIGFLDPGSGKIENRTRFSFKVTRALGFEAGEYQVKILDGRNGSQIGAQTKLTLKGQNETIDRRPIVFSGEKKKKKDDVKKVGSDSDAGTPKSQDEGSEYDGPPPSRGEDPDYDEGAEEETLKEKPGGCGCRTAPAGSSGAALLALLALGGVLALRRRS